MTTAQTSSPQATPSTSGAPSAPWLRLSRHVGRQGLIFALGTLVVLALGWALAYAMARLSDGETLLPTTLLGYLSVSTVPWLAFAALIGTVGAVVRPLGHAGFTRRAVVLAGLVSSALVGLVLAIGSGGLWAVGIEAVETTTSEGVWHPAPVYAVIGVLALQCTTAAASGLMVGASFVRWGGWATLLLPLTAGLPFFAQDVLCGSVTLRGSFNPSDPPAWVQAVRDLSTAPTLGLSLAVLALTALGAWLVIRDLPLRPRAAA